MTAMQEAYQYYLTTINNATHPSELFAAGWDAARNNLKSEAIVHTPDYKTLPQIAAMMDRINTSIQNNKMQVK